MKILWCKESDGLIDRKLPSYRWLSRASGAMTASILLTTAIACTQKSPTGENSAGGNNQKKDVEITLVSFAVTKAAHEAIIPKFVAKWQQEHNQKVTFKQSYGGSGSQTRAVIDGLPPMSSI